MTSNLGSKGETFFEYLCDDAEGVVCNEPQRDRMGWDCVVEFQMPTCNLPIDLVSAPLASFVQIKSTEGNDRHCDIKLSNAERAAKNQSPTFILFLMFDKNERDPHSIYIKHVWQDIISQTMLRLRRASKSKNNKLNRQTMRVTFSDEDRIDADELLSKIRNFAEEHGSNYASEKKKIAETVGKPEHPITMNVNFTSGITLDDVLDHSIGLTPSLSVEGTKLSSTRFGIKLRTPDLDGGQGQLFFENTTEQSGLFVFNPEGGDPISNIVQILPCVSIPGMDEEKIRIRVKGSLIDFVFWPIKNKLNLNSLGLVGSGSNSWETVRNMAKLAVYSKSTNITTALWSDGVRVIHGSVDKLAFDGTVWDTNGEKLLQFFDAFEEALPPQMWPNGFGLKESHLGQLSQVADAFLALKGENNIKVEAELIGAPFSKVVDLVNIPVPIALPIGDYWFTAVLLGKCLDFDTNGIKSVFHFNEKKVLIPSLKKYADYSEVKKFIVGRAAEFIENEEDVDNERYLLVDTVFPGFNQKEVVST